MMKSIHHDLKTNHRGAAEHMRLRACLDDVNVLMLIEHNDDGGAISRPITFLEMDTNGALWCCSGRPTSAQLCVAKLTFTDAAHAIHVSLTGTCEINHDHWHYDRLKPTMSASALLEHPHPHSLRRTVLRFVTERAEYCDATASRPPATAMLSMPAAVPVAHDFRRFDRIVSVAR